jgi:hypothetical protein
LDVTILVGSERTRVGGRSCGRDLVCRNDGGPRVAMRVASEYSVVVNMLYAGGCYGC